MRKFTVILMSALLVLLATACLPPSTTQSIPKNVSRHAHPVAQVQVEQQTASLDATDVESLGAWTIDVEYDAATVTVTGCEVPTGGEFALSLCNPAYAAGVVRVVGFDAYGVSDDIHLADISYDGSAAFTVSVEEFADTDGEPIDASSVTVN